MDELYTTGTWQPYSGRQEAFVEAWTEFAVWTSSRPGAGTSLTRDTGDPGRFVSFGAWETGEAVRDWKSHQSSASGWRASSNTWRSSTRPNSH